MFERCASLERALVQAVLRDRSLLWSLSGYLDAADFSTPRYRLVWEALRSGRPAPELPDVAADGDAPDPEEAREAARQIKVLSALRRVSAVCTRTSRVLADGQGRDPAQVLSRFLQEANACAVPASPGVLFSGREWVRMGYADEIESRANSAARSFDLGLAQLTEGLSPEPGHLLILAGETGKGKTALALNLAANLGVSQRVPVLFINTEMSAGELAMRLYALLGQVPLSRLRSGNVTEEELGDLRRLMLEIEDNALWITDSLPWATVEQVGALVRQGVAAAGIRVVILDWVQRLQPSDPRKESWQLLAEAARYLKALAQEQRVLVVAVAQLTEEHRLALSRGMSREADGEVHLYQAPPGGPGTHYLEVRKARHAPAGARISLIMDRATLRFYEADRQQEAGQAAR
ncbi:MAG: DnaB-like helicase C-terminal domain-containing protein [Bacillota bacterium]